MKRLLFASLIFAVGCTTTQMDESAAPAEGTSPRIGEAHQQLIETYSAGDTEYSGFYNNFEFKATMINSAVRDGLVRKTGLYYQWDNEKLQAEREKANAKMQQETEVFLSFYTPDRRNDNLSETKAIWRVYLEAGGQRYQGKVKRLRSLLAELQALYPYHTRWNTAYEVSFPVPTTAVETQKVTLTVTGPLGTRNVVFNTVK